MGSPRLPHVLAPLYTALLPLLLPAGPFSPLGLALFTAVLGYHLTVLSMAEGVEAIAPSFFLGGERSAFISVMVPSIDGCVPVCAMAVSKIMVRLKIERVTMLHYAVHWLAQRVSIKYARVDIVSRDTIRTHYTSYTTLNGQTFKALPGIFILNSLCHGPHWQLRILLDCLLVPSTFDVQFSNTRNLAEIHHHVNNSKNTHMHPASLLL